MHLVPFIKKDYPLLIQWIKTEAFNLLWGGPLYQWPINIEQIGIHQKKDSVTAFVAVENEEKIGFIELVNISDHHYRLCRVLIADESLRGKGYGRKLVQLAIEYASQTLGADRLSLAVFTKNKKAFHLYQSLGFRTIPKKPDFREFKGERWPLRHMELWLD